MHDLHDGLTEPILGRICSEHLDTPGLRSSRTQWPLGEEPCGLTWEFVGNAMFVRLAEPHVWTSD
jgi:hypothetical protein